jgi:hypothetical protein
MCAEQENTISALHSKLKEREEAYLMLQAKVAAHEKHMKTHTQK